MLLFNSLPFGSICHICYFFLGGGGFIATIFDSRIIRRMMCESMLSTNAENAPITVAVVNQTALRALCFFFKQTGT